MNVDVVDALTGTCVVDCAADSLSRSVPSQMCEAEVLLSKGVHGEGLSVTEMKEHRDRPSEKRELSSLNEQKNIEKQTGSKPKTAEQQLDNKKELPRTQKTEAEPQLSKMQSDQKPNKKYEPETKNETKADSDEGPSIFAELVSASTDSMEHFQIFEPSNPIPGESSESQMPPQIERTPSTTFLPAMPVEPTVSKKTDPEIARLDAAAEKKKEESVEEEQEEEQECDSQATVVEDDPADLHAQVQHE
jgi:hypothetical protein